MGKSAEADRPTFSVSAIRDYQTCPRMYYFSRVLGLQRESTHFAAIFGTAVHDAISNWHAFKRKTPLERVIKDYDEKILSELARARGKGLAIDAFEGEETILAYAETAEEILTGYTQDVRNDVDLVVNEHGFELWVESKGGTRYRFVGYVDQIRARPDGAVDVVDLKTGKRRPNDHALALDEQLSLYAIAAKRGRFRRRREDEAFQVNAPKIHTVQLAMLRDYCRYKKNEFAEVIKDPDKVKVPNPKGKGRDVIREIPNPKFEQGYKKGQVKGPVFYRSLRSDHDLKQAELDLARVCGSIQRKSFYRRSATGSCDFCKFKTECLQERAEPI